MKVGDKCKVRVPESKHDRMGTVLGIDGDNILVGVGQPHYFNYTEQIFNRRQVIRYVELSQEEADRIHAEQLPKMVELARKTFAELLPGEDIIEIDGGIAAYCNSVTIEPVIMERSTISAIYQDAGWAVTAWKMIPATRYEPDDVVDFPKGEFASYTSAVLQLAETVFGLKVQDYWNHLSDQAYAESMKEEF
jgi:hypothetical protein